MNNVQTVPEQCPGHDTKLNKPGRDLLDNQARSRPHVATALPPNPTNHVMTSILCRDLLFRLIYVATSISCRDLPYCRSCRDIKSMSRRRFCPTKADQVATSIPCRDLLETNLCRDIDFMTRHRFCHSEIFRS